MKDGEVFKKYSSNLTIIFKMIKCFMNNYKQYKCYNLYKNIENSKNFLKKMSLYQVNLSEYSNISSSNFIYNNN